MSSPAQDLALLADAAHAAGQILRDRFGGALETWSKGAAGPVTDVDLAVDKLLRETLTAARPAYGWLSEETADDSARLGKARAFSVDPLDGTRAFIQGVPDFCTSLAVVENGAPVAAVVLNPIKQEVFAAAKGQGATLNGRAITVSARDQLEGAHLPGQPGFYRDKRWPAPWPPLRATPRMALSYRLALVACGEFDGMVALGFKHEWDLAAGVLLVEEAGGRVSDPWGESLIFNQPDPRLPGAVASGPALYPVLLEQVRRTPHPSTFS
jgi:myo-inositol-1(or 4)-monophosphatase